MHYPLLRWGRGNMKRLFCVVSNSNDLSIYLLQSYHTKTLHTFIICSITISDGQQSNANQKIIVRSLKKSFEQYMSSSQYPLRQPFMRGISRIKGFLTELPHPTCPSHPQTYLCTLFIHNLCPIFYIWDFHTSFDTRFWAALWMFEVSASCSCIPLETASSHEYQGFLFGSCLTFQRR